MLDMVIAANRGQIGEPVGTPAFVQRSDVMYFQLSRAAAPLIYALGTAVAVAFKRRAAGMLPAGRIQPLVVKTHTNPPGRHERRGFIP